MYLSEDDTRPENDEALNASLTGPGIFASSVKRFELQARNIKRGFQVNQAIRSLRASAGTEGVAKLEKERPYVSLSPLSGKAKRR
ncbi:MAG TPA: hypothetical protein VF682_09835 [Pseudomonas sp.]|jgi:hypothetical protein